MDSLNFKKLLRNCVDKNQNMENWYDNFYEAAKQSNFESVSSLSVDELVKKMIKDKG